MSVIWANFLMSHEVLAGNMLVESHYLKYMQTNLIIYILIYDSLSLSQKNTKTSFSSHSDLAVQSSLSLFLTIKSLTFLFEESVQNVTSCLQICQGKLIELGPSLGNVDPALLYYCMEPR